MNQDNIEDCIRRVRAAKNIGMSLEDTIEGFHGIYTKDEVFLAWHAACILDKDAEKPADSTPERKTMSMRAQKR